jgi:hypothetical protein
MLTLEPCRGELPPTRAYDRRQWTWEPADRYDSVDRDGTLTILLTHTGKRRVRTEVSVYAVQVELEVLEELGVWSFLLENWTENDPLGPFRCIVGSAHECCGCEAFRYGLGCKHRDALRAILEQGAFA